ncbi:molecular chaperone HtpG [Tyzzerella sp. An114]|uniref:molecular chaperone HtpG n=1 Tax=Tyzzerella sp. An114 TaxID=1965545 RepID=UPI000B42E52D|nr:molecular chaperone HtpG [Tyzzerella sp. An114]OUQ58810.1 molecular chaperone HtpG [Tyzzerella sp. An114]
MEKGNLSINSENFLPIIKKWLYTDKDIFVRELVSNGCDAVTKLKKLMGMGEAPSVKDDEKFAVNVVLDKENKTIKIIDNGIGMTADEVKKYINQIAFSGATDFLSKYEEKSDEENDIIGHFGLGFYSAFMVAEKVEIDTLSYIEGSEAAKWICEGGIDYEMEKGERTERGTTITLYIGDDGEEFLNEGTLYTTLKKYCSFMPVPIYIDTISNKEDEKEEEKSNVIHATPEEAEKIAETGKIEDEEEKEPVPLNDVNPLWLRQPKECTDEDYKKFYHDVFMDMNDPLFWIHLNMDYPFRLKGILYFPKIVNEMDAMDGQIKLYSNQVYIADNIKEVVPEFLLLLKGVIDCPDLPLNVSRSALQNDGYAGKMSSYITKKVADKLNSMFKNERKETYEKFWDDISVFIKYGCMREEKLYDKIKDSLLFKTTDDIYVTLNEYLEECKDKHENKMFYFTDKNQQIQYINLFKENDLVAVDLSTAIDKPFVSFLEYKNNGIKLQRIDADISDVLKNDEVTSDELNTEVQNLFRGILGKEKLNVKMEGLKAENVSAMILLSEESRRIQEMKEAYAKDEMMSKMFGNIEAEETLVLNSSNKLIKLLVNLKGREDRKEDTELVAKQIYDLALMGHKTLSPEEMTAFIDRSNKILEKLVEFENK